jgi:(heptosyl)LPS beta-1,4-glucosyltransferase
MVGLCSEVIVLDSGSTDDTVRIAHHSARRVEQTRLAGLRAAEERGDRDGAREWVLLLDADEWLEAPAQSEVRACSTDIKAPGEQADVWLLMRRTHFLGHALRGGSFAREPVHRLFRSTLRHGLRAVHEYLDVEGRIVRPSRVVLEHDTARSAEDYWSKLQRTPRLGGRAAREEARPPVRCAACSRPWPTC